MIKETNTRHNTNRINAGITRRQNWKGGDMAVMESLKADLERAYQTFQQVLQNINLDCNTRVANPTLSQWRSIKILLQINLSPLRLHSPSLGKNSTSPLIFLFKTSIGVYPSVELWSRCTCERCHGQHRKHANKRTRIQTQTTGTSCTPRKTPTSFVRRRSISPPFAPRPCKDRDLHCAAITNWGTAQETFQWLQEGVRPSTCQGTESEGFCSKRGSWRIGEPGADR